MTKKECLSMTIDEIRAAYREWLTKNTNRVKTSKDTTISDALCCFLRITEGGLRLWV